MRIGPIKTIPDTAVRGIDTDPILREIPNPAPPSPADNLAFLINYFYKSLGQRV